MNLASIIVLYRASSELDSQPWLPIHPRGNR